MSKDDKTKIYDSPDFQDEPSVKLGIKSPEEFRRLYGCNVDLGQRDIELYKRLQDYRNQDDGNASQQWREFKAWCRDNGYTQEEVNRAKKNSMIKL